MEGRLRPGVSCHPPAYHRQGYPPPHPPSPPLPGGSERIRPGGREKKTGRSKGGNLGENVNGRKGNSKYFWWYFWWYLPKI